MEKLYSHNSLLFVGNTSPTRENSATLNFNSLLVPYYPSLRQEDIPHREFSSETLSYFYSNDEYMGSTSPYDDDGC